MCVQSVASAHTRLLWKKGYVTCRWAKWQASKAVELFFLWMAQLVTFLGYVSNLSKAILGGLDESEKGLQIVSILIAKWGRSSPSPSKVHVKVQQKCVGRTGSCYIKHSTFSHCKHKNDQGCLFYLITYLFLLTVKTNRVSTVYSQHRPW